MLEFNVNNQIIMRKDEVRVVADSRDYLKATFTLTDEWQGQVVAVFCHGDGVYHQTLTENCCMVPAEVIKAPGFTVSLFCEAQALVTANVIWVETEPSGLRNGTQPQPPTPDLWQQYMRKMSLMIESGLPYIGDNYHWFLFDPEKGDYEDAGIVAKGEAGCTPQKGTDYWTEEDKEEIKSYVDDKLVHIDEKIIQNQSDIKELQESGSVSNDFIITGNAILNDDKTLTITDVSATFDEIAEAYNEGKDVRCVGRFDGIDAEFTTRIYFINREFIMFTTVSDQSELSIVRCFSDNRWSGENMSIVKTDVLEETISADNETFKSAVLNCFPDADTMTFPLENTISEVSEE